MYQRGYPARLQLVSVSEDGLQLPQIYIYSKQFKLLLLKYLICFTDMEHRQFVCCGKQLYHLKYREHKWPRRYGISREVLPRMSFRTLMQVLTAFCGTMVLHLRQGTSNCPSSPYTSPQISRGFDGSFTLPTIYQYPEDYTHFAFANGTMLPVENYAFFTSSTWFTDIVDCKTFTDFFCVTPA